MYISTLSQTQMVRYSFKFLPFRITEMGLIIFYSRLAPFLVDVFNYKVRFAATIHHSSKPFGYIIVLSYVLNLHHQIFTGKSLQLRKTKRDKADTRSIAIRLMFDMNLQFLLRCCLPQRGVLAALTDSQPSHALQILLLF